MQSIPPEADYLILVLLFSVVCVAIFLEELRELSTTFPFWCGLISWTSISTALDCLAIQLGWWAFSDDKILGICVFSVPLEEIALFIAIYLFAVCAWES